MASHASQLLIDLLQDGTRQQLDAMVRDDPDIVSQTTRDELGGLSKAPGYGAPFGHLFLLVRDYPVDPDGAWNRFQAERTRAASMAEHLDRLLDALSALPPDTDSATVAKGALEAFAFADAIGHGWLACELLAQRGRALATVTGSERAEMQEEARSCFGAALEIAMGGAQAATRLMELANFFSDRVLGDRAENQAAAVDLARQAISELGTPADDEGAGLLARFQTNLSVSLLRSERGDPVTRLREACSLCEAALAFRGVDRDPIDWAFSTINLGEALFELSRRDNVDLGLSSDAFRSVIRHENEINEPHLVGMAYHALGRIAIWEARMTAEDYVAEYDGDPRDEPSISLETGHAYLERAVVLLDEGGNRLEYGRAVSDLSDIVSRLGDTSTALKLGHVALGIVLPANDPRSCLELARRVAAIHADREEWAESARLFEIAVRASDVVFHSRLETVSRESELRSAGNLGRWAAFALARAGNPQRAVEVLEASRGRELRRRLGIAALGREIDDLPPDIREQFESALDALRRAPVTAAGDAAASDFQRVTVRIRELDGFSDFGIATTLDAVARAADDGWPVVYVNPTRWGTALFRVGSPAGDPAVTTRFLPTISAMDVLIRLVTGGRDPEEQDDPDSHGSYFFALAGAPLASMRDGLESTLIWVGKALARPIHDLVSDIPAEGVTLVPCGPIATAPLHASPWYDADGQPRCLLDSMAVRYAPSAATIVGARAQAETSDAMPHCLVAVADPKSNLPAARGEVMEISRLFPEAAIAAYGADATRRFVAEYATSATHLHLACHGAGGLIENSDASLELADGSMDSRTLTELAGFHARLVAISACESAVSEITGVPGEMFSLGVAALVAGAACTIASLWSVDDLATGLLMTKLYAVMLAHPLRPPEALRAAQLWLRDLSEDDEQAFLDVHPALAAEFRKRGVESVVASHRRGPSQGARRDETAAHPELWAAFIAMGV